MQYNTCKSIVLQVFFHFFTKKMHSVNRVLKIFKEILILQLRCREVSSSENPVTVGVEPGSRLCMTIAEEVIDTIVGMPERDNAARLPVLQSI